MTGRIHILPVNDRREHVHSEACWCAPSVMREQNGVLIIHNAADAREFFEPQKCQHPDYTKCGTFAPFDDSERFGRDDLPYILGQRIPLKIPY